MYKNQRDGGMFENLAEQSSIIERSLWQLYAPMMSWVGCLLTDLVLSDTWKLREKE